MNEIKKANEAHGVVFSPERFGRDIAETQILWVSTSRNRSTLKVHELLASELYKNIDQLKEMPLEEREMALDSYRNRMQQAYEATGQSFWQVPGLVTTFSQ